MYVYLSIAEEIVTVSLENLNVAAVEYEDIISVVCLKISINL